METNNTKHFFNDILNFFEEHKNELTTNKEIFISNFNEYKNNKLIEYNLNEEDVKSYLEKISKFDI